MITFFFDKCCGRRIPENLSKERPDLSFEWHGRFFEQNASDDFIFQRIAEKNWFMITQDQKFHRVPSERMALIQHNIGCFYLEGANAEWWISKKAFLAACGGILEAVETTPRPFLYRVTLKGKVVWYDLKNPSGAHRQDWQSKDRRSQ